jgi:hypothetical protein
MKARVLLVVLALIVVMASGGAMVAAKSAVVPFKATYVTYPRAVGPPVDGVLTLNIPGEGKATHLGKSTWYATMWVDTKPYPWTQGSDDMVFTAANGDQLFGSYVGYAEPPTAEGIIKFWGDFQITHGTGRFEGATATGKYWGQCGSDEGGILYFDGTLTK